MFVGHYGASFLAKKADDSIPLWVLFLAVQLLDVVWAPLVLLGIERVRIVPGFTGTNPLDLYYMPFTHSLVAAVAWSAAAAIAYRLWAGMSGRAGRGSRGAFLVGIAVLSHWALDFVVHRPDLPLYPGSETKMGFGVWDSFPATLVIEIAMFGLGVWLYSASTKAADRIGKYAYFAFVIFLILVYFANAFAPPPPNATAVAIVATLAWLFPFWAAWFDKHRTPIS